MVEDVLTDEDLTALMETREHDGWAAELAGGVVRHAVLADQGHGWNALIRAAFTFLLPLQCEGANPAAPVGGREDERPQAQVSELRGLRLRRVPMGHRRPRADLQSEHVHRVRPAASRRRPPSSAPLQSAGGQSSGRVLSWNRDETRVGSPSTARFVRGALRIRGVRTELCAVCKPRRTNGLSKPPEFATHSAHNFDLDSITLCETIWAGRGRLADGAPHRLGAQALQSVLPGASGPTRPRNWSPRGAASLPTFSPESPRPAAASASPIPTSATRIAGHIVETVAGKPYEPLLCERVFVPLMLTSARFGAPRGEARNQEPIGHVVVLRWFRLRMDPFRTPADNSPVMAPAGTVHMTIGALARYGVAHREGESARLPTLLPHGAWERSHTPVLDDYARGRVRVERDWAGGPVLWHNGSNTMWYALPMLLPAATRCWRSLPTTMR